METDFASLTRKIQRISPFSRFGKVVKVNESELHLKGVTPETQLGDAILLSLSNGDILGGEIVSLTGDHAVAMTYAPCRGVALGDLVEIRAPQPLCPHLSWRGRIIDAFGAPLDGRPLANGPNETPLHRKPPPAATRRRLGVRLQTGMRCLDTLLPIVEGQRIGLFAGSGVGKTTLLATMAKKVPADVIVCALIGERGRELRAFVEDALGPEGLERAIVVTATSDQSPLIKRRAAYTAMAVAEYFCAQGMHSLLLMDSVTRFAEAHREIALMAGEPPSLRAYPPSTAHLISSLIERAGPGPEGAGMISAVFSVLVAGSDMEEPVADMTRGCLDGHIVMDRTIAERGRFPAIDLLKSVSRSLPEAATEGENKLIADARRMLSKYEQAEPMLQTGLYSSGADKETDRAIKIFENLDSFLGQATDEPIQSSFHALRRILAAS
ncbi:FliI/YscN family ATPase [Paracoccaceae bacterium GXU_MW_L88]